ncbi:hypothetical protein DA717_14810 [Piscirickettsiaceae bacterium NZ-RLO2]|nr:hypothetical protein DA717_14810 [Piscirickettsiaceae bacterium NZ-RLO2]
MAIINDVEKDIDCSYLVLQRQKELKEELLKLSSNQTSTPVPCLDQNNIAKGKDLGKLDTLGQLSSFGWKPGENNQGSQQATPSVPCLDQNNIAKGKDLGKLDTLGQLSSFGWKPGENNQGSQQATPFQRQSESRSDQEHQENERATKKCCTIM